MHKIIFSHIPKAAGTAVRVHLNRLLPAGSRLLIHDCVGGLAPYKWPTYKLPDDLRLLTGHLKAGDFIANPEVRPDDPEIVFFSILRDLIDRIMSVYNYARSTPQHPSFTAMQRVALDTFLSSQPANYQCEWLQLPDGLAWTIVLTDVSHLRSGLRMLADAADLPDFAIAACQPDQRNVTAKLNAAGPPLASRSEIPADLIEALQTRHRRDYELLEMIASARGALCFNASAPALY